MKHRNEGVKKIKLAASSTLHEAKIAYYAFDVIVTSLPLTLYRSRSCADVLRGERADVTDFFLFS